MQLRARPGSRHSKPVPKPYLDRPDVAFHVGKKLLDFGFLTRIDAKSVDAMAGSLQFVHKPLGFGGVTPADTNGIAAFGKTPRHGRADGVACAHKYCYAATFCHSRFSP